LSTQLNVVAVVFIAIKFQVLLLILVAVLNEYTSLKFREFDPVTYNLKVPFVAISIIRVEDPLLFDLNQQLKAAVFPDEVGGKTMYEAPGAL
jgi:hypothetical protein